MPIVSVPGPYQGPTGGRGEIPVAGGSVRSCLEAVEAQHPGFLELVLDPDGTLHRFVKLFVNEEEITPGELERSLEESDRLEVLAAIAGG